MVFMNELTCNRKYYKTLSPYNENLRSLFYWLINQLIEPQKHFPNCAKMVYANIYS